MSRIVEPYQVSKPPKIDVDTVTTTIEVIVPLNHGNGSMKFSLTYTTLLSGDFCYGVGYGVNGPYISTQYDQYLAQEQCNPILVCLDDTIARNIKLVLDYFSFIRRRLEVEGKGPPMLDEFREMLWADVELKRILIDCDE